MTTVTVDIAEKDLLNYTIIDNMNLEMYDENGHNNLFKQYSFTLYQKRIMGDDKVTMQISLHRFLLFKGFGLVK